AARYANAAGVAGQYEVAVAQLFRTQSSWGLSSDIDAQLSQVLPPDVMTKVRNLIHSDLHLDDSVMADLTQGHADQIARTPSVVIVKNGERHILQTVDYATLKASLDQ